MSDRDAIGIARLLSSVFPSKPFTVFLAMSRRGEPEHVVLAEPPGFLVRDGRALIPRQWFEGGSLKEEMPCG